MPDGDRREGSNWEELEQEVCLYAARKFGISIKRSALRWEPEEDGRPDGKGRYGICEHCPLEGKTNEDGKQIYVCLQGDSFEPLIREEALLRLKEDLHVDPAD